MKSKESLTLAHTASSASEAELIRSILDGQGVYALIPDKNVPFPGLDLTPLDGEYKPSGCEVLVRAEDAARAREVIEEARQAGQLDFEEDEEPEDLEEDDGDDDGEE
ncbi:MAG: DUF2007 domain-containing protein [Planctomycetes bacterium]|nr:DUF2007 domain-containing protein [Planctomycetota bacterium]